MTKDTKSADWLNVDTDKLPKALGTAYATLKDAQAKARTVREGFEETFIANARAKKAIGDNETLIFGYRFGKLAVAKVEKAKASATKTSGGSFTF